MVQARPRSRAGSRTGKQSPTIVVRGLGYYYPEYELSTHELIMQERPNALFAKKMRRLIGCDTVREAGPDDTPSSMASEAASIAIEAAKIDARDIELVCNVGCVLPDIDIWSMSAKIAQRIGALGAECFGVGDAACASAYAAMRALLPIVRDHEGPRLVLAATGCIMPGGRFFPPATIFGDGAGAMVLERVERPRAGDLRLVRCDLYSHPKLADAFGPAAGMNTLRTSGRLEPRWWTFSIRDAKQYDELRRVNYDLGAHALATSLYRAGWTIESLTAVAPDNINVAMGRDVSTRLGLPADRIIDVNCAKYGHAFAADMFVNLHTAQQLHPPRSGDRFACLGSGQGQHWGVLLTEVI